MFTPKQITTEFVNDNGKEVIRVEIPKTELKTMFRRRGKWACEHKTSEWGRGKLKDAVEVGLRGEIAFAKINNLSVNIASKAAGTGGGSDFEIKKVTLELKTKKMGSKHNHLLVRCIDDYGDEVPLESDIYIAARQVSALQVPGHEVVHLMGWIEKTDLEKLETVPGRVGPHKNKEVSFADLCEMRKLLDLIS